MTHDDLQKLGYRQQPDGSYSRPTLAPMAARLPNPEPQRATRPALDKTPKRKAPSTGRITLRITRRASRLLDTDNFAGGCKPIIDQCRYAGLIPDDDPASVEIVFRQEKVRPTAAGVLIEILPNVLTNPEQ